jgi:excisionase family DNA binding protein
MSIFNEPPSVIDPIAVPQQEAAKALGVSAQRLRKWEREGKISGTRMGRRCVLYAVDDLKQLARYGRVERETP